MTFTRLNPQVASVIPTAVHRVPFGERVLCALVVGTPQGATARLPIRLRHDLAADIHVTRRADVAEIVAVRPGLEAYDDKVLAALWSWPDGASSWPVPPTPTPRGGCLIALRRAIEQSRHGLDEIAVPRESDGSQWWSQDGTSLAQDWGLPARDAADLAVRVWGDDLEPGWYVVDLEGEHGPAGGLAAVVSPGCGARGDLLVRPGGLATWYPGGYSVGALATGLEAVSPLVQELLRRAARDVARSLPPA